MEVVKNYTINWRNQTKKVIGITMTLMNMEGIRAYWGMMHNQSRERILTINMEMKVHWIVPMNFLNHLESIKVKKIF